MVHTDRTQVEIGSFVQVFERMVCGFVPVSYTISTYPGLRIQSELSILDPSTPILELLEFLTSNRAKPRRLKACRPYVLHPKP